MNAYSYGGCAIGYETSSKSTLLTQLLYVFVKSLDRSRENINYDKTPATTIAKIATALWWWPEFSCKKGRQLAPVQLNIGFNSIILIGSYVRNFSFLKKLTDLKKLHNN